MPNWYLESLNITGGFLAGLSLRFPAQLICIIGPRGSGKSTLAEARRIACDVAQQLAQLGSLSEDRRRVCDLLWKDHSRDAMAKSWERHASAELKSKGANPVDVFNRLAANQDRVWIKLRACSHGDLHAKNVAIDPNAIPAQAFIIDAAVMDPALAVRDLAYLEVSSILFQSADDGCSVVERCTSLFADAFLPREDINLKGEPHRIHNTALLVREIRKTSQELGDSAIYSLMVFDSALIELGGLAIQSSRNWIAAPADAALLASLAADWLVRLFPHLVGQAVFPEGGRDESE